MVFKYLKWSIYLEEISCLTWVLGAYLEFMAISFSHIMFTFYLDDFLHLWRFVTNTFFWRHSIWHSFTECLYKNICLRDLYYKSFSFSCFYMLCTTFLFYNLCSSISWVKCENNMITCLQCNNRIKRRA